MQSLGSHIIDISKKVKIKSMEKELRTELNFREDGEMFLCPFCKYESRNNKKGTAKIFKTGTSVSFKCFACGKWRRV